MGAEAALLEAICAAPERDEPRLVYADWLLERQNPRGELIQLQIAQAKTLRRSAPWAALQRRVEALWSLHWREWTPKPPAPAPCGWTFSRGFPTGVRTAADAFADDPAAFFASAPLLEKVELECGIGGRAPPALDRIFAAPAFSRVKSLGLHSIDDVGVVTLSGIEAAGRLGCLLLSHTNLGLQTFKLLGSADSSLLRLPRLELTMANAQDLALESLFERNWPRLESLSVGNDAVGERGMRAICSGRVAGLRSLDLSWSLTGGASAIAVLAQSQQLSKLTSLDLSYCALDDAGCEALAGANGFWLTELRLAHAAASAKGIAALLTAPWIDRLELLELTGSRLDVRSQALLTSRLKDRVVFGPTRGI